MVGRFSILRVEDHPWQTELAVGQDRADQDPIVTDGGTDRQTALFSEVQEVANIGAWEVDLRTDELYWTDEVARIHGLSPGYDQTLEEAFEFYHPEDRPEVEDAFERAGTEGEPYDLTVRLIRPDGEQRWVRTRGVPEIEDGTPIRIRGSIQDVTENQERKQELRRYEAIIEALDDAVYAVDENGTVKYVNERYAEMKGIDREDIIGSPMRKWATDEEADRIYDLVAELEAGNLDVAELEYDFQTVDGESIPAELRFTDMEFPDGRHGRVGVIRDITERKERKRQVERQNERLEKFASVVSHDLRSPLNVAQGSVELLREEHESDQIDRIDRSLARMEAIIEDVLTLTQEGERISEPEPVDLRDVATDCFETVVSSRAELSVESNLTLLADESRLKQLLENLLRNAVEHGEAVEQITIGSLEDGFYVADDGVGIPEDEREAVFEAGYSGHSQGTGLGLNIVEEVAHAHGWEVGVTESVDGGARFEITGIETV